MYGSEGMRTDAVDSGSLIDVDVDDRGRVEARFEEGEGFLLVIGCVGGRLRKGRVDDNDFISRPASRYVLSSLTKLLSISLCFKTFTQL